MAKIYFVTRTKQVILLKTKYQTIIGLIYGLFSSKQDFVSHGYKKATDLILMLN